jgi:membrane protein implicated in regulation of membrane protease activity
MYGRPPGGPLSDPRHGRSRADGMSTRTGLVPLVVALALGVLATYGLVTASSPWIRYGSISVIGLAVAWMVWRWVRRRPKRQSLDEALRSRR